MVRCFVFFLTAMFIEVIAHAQLVNNGATITVQSGATIKCTGTIINNSGGLIQNAGTVSSDGEIRNESGGTLNGTTGAYEATTKFINKGTFTGTINLKLIGNLNTDSILSGGASFVNVNITKGAGNTATLSDAMTVTGAITFDNDDNRLILADKNLTMGSTATFVSADANEFVVTNSTGAVTKQSLGSTPFTFEVGYGTGEYNPLTISNTNTNDISVRCLQNVLANGLTGSTVASHFANNSWVVSQAGSGANLQLTTTWAASDEPAGVSNFNRAKVGIARYNTGTDWDLPASNVVAASGTDPYTRTRNNITSLGVFAVADLAQVNTAKLNLRVYLQGPGVTNIAGVNEMGDLLRDDPGTGPVDPVIPTTQPYSAALNARFTRVGIYDGTSSVNETVNASVFNVTGRDAIVDWVYISTIDTTVIPFVKLQTRAALLQRDGDVVDLDGVSPVSMPIDNDGNYNFLVSHRNHLSVRTRFAKPLADVITPYAFDFSTAQLQAYQSGSITTNPAMKDLGGGVFCMWGGNASGNNVVRYSTPGNDPASILTAVGNIPTGNLSNVYSINDVNFDRKVKYSTPGNDLSFILGQVLGSVTTAFITEHL